MKKRVYVLISLVLAGILLLGGCGGQEEQETTASGNGVEQTQEEEPVLADGIYEAVFTTDSSMFHVSEACEGKGILKVEDGVMTIHISLTSKNIVNLYPGLAADAEKEGAELLEPTEDTVTYSDGMTEEVYGFDVPVPVLDEEFDLALVGTKGVWYDHKVMVSAPQPLEEEGTSPESLGLEDGSYSVELTFEGGSGRAEVYSPAIVTLSGDSAIATIEWSSPNYDYMLVNGEQYLPVNEEGNSVFEIPVLFFDAPMKVIGDTVAMSKPYEIEYTLTFHSDTMTQVE